MIERIDDPPGGSEEVTALRLALSSAGGSLKANSCRGTNVDVGWGSRSGDRMSSGRA